MAGVDHNMLKKFETLSLSSRRAKRSSNIRHFLPGGIIFNILLFVPVEILFSVMRFVCQEWHNIINHPSFIDARLQRSTTSSSFLIQFHEHRELVDIVESNNCIDVRLRDFNHFFPKPVLSSCDGLVLFCDDEDQQIYSVANPITNETLTLPPLFKSEPEPDPKSTTLFVLVRAAHSTRRIYKVVRVFHNHRNEYKCCILTVGAEMSWRLVDTERIPDPHLYFSETALFVNGYLYWTRRVNNGCLSSLLAMNVETEIMHRVPYPQFFNKKVGGFAVREDFLTFIFEDDSFVCEVWALTDLNAGEWTSLFNINLCRLRHLFKRKSWCNFEYKRLLPLGWLKNGELVMFRVLKPWRAHIVYNMKTEKITSFPIRKRDLKFKNYYYAHVNSLVPLKGL